MCFFFQGDGALASQCVFRVLDAHPRSLNLVRSGLECLRVLALGLSDPAAVLHQLLEHDPVQALGRDRVRGPRQQLMHVISALQTRIVSVSFSLCDGRLLFTVYSGSHSALHP